MVIYMQVWLGDHIGHKPLQGLMTDKPSDLARNFAQLHNLSTATRYDLQMMVSEKLKNHKLIYSKAQE